MIRMSAWKLRNERRIEQICAIDVLKKSFRMKFHAIVEATGLSELRTMRALRALERTKAVTRKRDGFWHLGG